MRQQKFLILSLFLIVPLLNFATDLKPWFGSEYEVELRATALYQNYNSISTPAHHNFKTNANDVFLTLSAIYPFKRFSGEFEVTAAHTQHQDHRFDNYRATGRYQWMNEFDGDLFSMVTSITLTQAMDRALHDVSSFHHGHIEGEFDLSFGKEYGYSCYSGYQYRWWAVAGIGTSDMGSPWVRGDVAGEYIFSDVHQFRGFVHSLWGKGNKVLHPYHFHGYGNVRHESVDLGVRYGYDFGCWGTVSLEYARRVYAYNFPKNANLVLLEYYFPFGMQAPCDY